MSICKKEKCSSWVTDGRQLYEILEMYKRYGNMQKTAGNPNNQKKNIALIERLIALHGSCAKFPRCIRGMYEDNLQFMIDGKFANYKNTIKEMK